LLGPAKLDTTALYTKVDKAVLHVANELHRIVIH
jgi:hypothetical protein